jgi:hypothetical protein
LGFILIVTRGKVHNAEVLPGFAAMADDAVKGIITYHIEGNDCEIVSLDSLQENNGIEKRSSIRWFMWQGSTDASGFG